MNETTADPSCPHCGGRGITYPRMVQCGCTVSQTTASNPRDRAIELLENRVAELEMELDYWRQMEKLKELEHAI